MTRAKPAGAAMAKDDFEKLAHFRYQLRRFLRFSEEATRSNGVTELQYLLLLQIKGYPGGNGQRSASSPNGFRRNSTASCRSSRDASRRAW
jgi:hypothetical protein